MKAYNPLSNLSPKSLPEGLTERVLACISREARRYRMIRMVYAVVTTGVSMAGVVFAVRYATLGLSHSGFLSYLSLLFSDGGYILSYWKEFSVSLIESLPVMSVVAVLAAIIALLWSVRWTWASYRNTFAYGVSALS